MSTQVSLAQAAQILKVSEKSIRRYIKSGKMKAALVKGERGHEYRINKDLLKGFAKPPRGKNSHLSRGITRRVNSAKSRIIPAGPRRKLATKAKKKQKYFDDEEIKIPIAPKIDSFSEILEQRIQNTPNYLKPESQRSENIDYKLLYERLLAKYEQTLIMIGSLEAQGSDHSPQTNGRVEKLENELAKQEELILGLYQDLRLYKENDNARY